MLFCVLRNYRSYHTMCKCDMFSLRGISRLNFDMTEGRVPFRKKASALNPASPPFGMPSEAQPDKSSVHTMCCKHVIMLAEKAQEET